MIYLDNAATSYQRPPEVEEAVCRALHSMGNSGRGAYAPTLDASRVIYSAREKAARLFNAEAASRIAFTANATEALNIAIQGILMPGDHVITTACEHNSVLRPLYLMESRGVNLSIICADKKGNIDYSDIEKSIRPDTRAIVITHASNLTGNVTDIGIVSQIADKHGIILIVDASQSAGSIPINVQEQGIDVLCFTGHKGLMGPQGTGGIYVKEGIQIRPLIVGGSGVKSFSKTHPDDMPAALEAGTLPGHGIAGLSAGLDFIEHTGLETIHEKEIYLADRFKDGVNDIRGVKVYGDFELPERVGIVSLNIGDTDSARVSDMLWEEYKICVRSGAHCAPLMHKALGTDEQGAVRFSFSYFNTEAETDKAIEAVKAIAGEI